MTLAHPEPTAISGRRHDPRYPRTRPIASAAVNFRGLLGGLIVLVLLGGVGTALVDPFDDGDDVAATSQESSTTSTSDGTTSTTLPSDGATATSTATTSATATTSPAPATTAPGTPTTQLVGPPPTERPRGAPSGTADGELAFTGSPIGGPAGLGLALLALALAAGAASRRSAA